MPSTLKQVVDRVKAAKTEIANAITAKGGTVGANDGLEEFASDIATIPSGGSSSSNDVNFYDYDGTIVQSYSAGDFANLSALPANPTHEGLTAQGWNWSLADAKAYVAKYSSLNIGQMYTTSDGKTRIYISLPEGRTSPILQLYLNDNSFLDIDWGDGTHSSPFFSTSADYNSERHEYSTSGDYVITITVLRGGFVLQTSATRPVSSILWNGNDSTSSPDIAYNNAIKKIEIGNGVTSIGAGAFYSCTSLLSITIPDSVTSIDAAFYGCYSLSSITIPNSVTSIGVGAFQNCSSLSSITIPDSVTSIGSGAFQNCSSLSSITIPDSVTSIGVGAFQNCSSLSSVTIPDSVTSIGVGPFQNCSSLSSVTIPDSVKSISVSAFQNCSSLSSVTIPNSVTSIGSSAFKNCSSLSSITIPDSVTSIDQSVFYNCYSLSSVTIPDSVTRIGAYAFQNCRSLSSITIPDGVKSIYSQAFYQCYSLSSITIPDSVTNITGQAFKNCSFMSYIKFKSTTPPTVTSSNVWSGVSTSTKILVPAGTLNTYKTATNYPNPSTYTYEEY